MNARLLCPSLSPGVCSNSSPLNQWCHPTNSTLPWVIRVNYLSAELTDISGQTFQVALVVKHPPANAGDLGSNPGLGRSPGGGHGNPLQYSCLENSTDRGAWWTTVCGVTKSWVRLKWLRLQARMHKGRKKVQWRNDHLFIKFWISIHPWWSYLGGGKLCCSLHGGPYIFLNKS